jgi:DNA mismatch repair ATPase MutL
LATLLGERYRSTEQALKELVDNAWDADAPNVWITLPGAMTFDPITVRDDGTGMTERELRQEYLKSKSPGTEPLARASARPASTA